jgi:HSP20 family protein
MAGTLSTQKPRGLFQWGRKALPGLREEMEELLSRVWDEDGDGWFAGTMRPSVDLSETDKTVEVRMDVPGIKAEEIDVQINNNLLTVSGDRKEEREEKGKTYHRVERRTGSFSRSFALPCPVAEDEVVAEYRDGILTITMPKTEEAKSHRIKVKC